MNHEINRRHHLSNTLQSALLGPRVSPWLVLRMYRAQPIHPRQAPDPYGALHELARRAGLDRPPTLYDRVRGKPRRSGRGRLARTAQPS